MFKRRRLAYQRQPRVPAEERAPGTGAPPVKHRFTRLRREVLFALLVLLLTGGTVFALASGGVALQQRAHAAGTSPAPHTHLVIGQARVIVDKASSGDAGLMQPTVDRRGNVWVGEMYANRFARFDSQREAITTWLAPHGNDGIMDTTVDSHGDPWFVELNANYLARFDAATHTFHLFPLGKVGGRPLGPQDLQFDQKGVLWFTAAIAGRIGRLDPATGKIQTWPVPAPAPGITPSPYSLAVTSGGQVWFGLLSGGAIGNLDPATGHITLYHLADPQAQIFSLASDARGRLWFTEMVPGKLGMFDPTTKKTTEIPVPAFSGHPAALYGLVIAPGGDVWFANSGADALVRYAPAAATFTFYQLSTSYGGLYGLALDSTGHLWFTIEGDAANYIGELSTQGKGT